MTLLDLAHQTISAELRCPGHHSIAEIGALLANDTGADEAVAIRMVRCAANTLATDGLVELDGEWLTPTAKLDAQWHAADHP